MAVLYMKKPFKSCNVSALETLWYGQQSKMHVNAFLLIAFQFFSGKHWSNMEFGVFNFFFQT